MSKNDNAKDKISDDGKVYGEARVCKNARVYGDAKVYDSAGVVFNGEPLEADVFYSMLKDSRNFPKRLRDYVRYKWRSFRSFMFNFWRDCHFIIIWMICFYFVMMLWLS